MINLLYIQSNKVVDLYSKSTYKFSSIISRLTVEFRMVVDLQVDDYRFQVDVHSQSTLAKSTANTTATTMLDQLYKYLLVGVVMVLDG